MVKICIVDSTDDVDTTTIQLRVNGVLYTWPDPHLEWVDDSILVFTPTTAFSNGETVDVVLEQASDDDGYPLQGAPVSWQFYMDFDFPFFLPETRYPPPGTTVCADVGSIAVTVMDTTSGIPYDGLCMCFNTSASGFSCPSNRSSGWCWEPGTDTTTGYADSSFFVLWDALGFADEDSIQACLAKAIDRVGTKPDYAADVCGPHWFDTTDVQQCWTFVKDCIRPRVYLIFPDDGDTTACDSIVVGFVDISGVDTTYVQISVTGGMAFIHTSPYFNASPDGDTAYYIAPLPEGNVTARILRTRDMAGNTTGPSFPVWGFYVDKSPPEVSSPLPPDGGVVSTSTPNMSAAIADAYTSVDPNSIVFTVEGISYPYSSPAVSWDGSRASFSCSAAGLSFSDGDTVDVCISAVCDVVPAGRCGPNCIDTPFCWSFVVDQGGPSAELVMPPDGAYTACPDQEIIIHLWDLSGVDSLSVVMTVEGVTYDSMENMTYRNDTLVFSPPAPFADGQEVSWTLDDAADILGNHIDSTLSGHFYVDLSPPSVVAIDPPRWTRFGPSLLVVEWTLLDGGAGVDPATAVVTVQGHSYPYPSGFSWDGSHLTFDLTATGLSFSDGETVAVCLHVGDAIPPELCGPNYSDTCTYFIADLAGPVADMVYPPHGAVTACADGEIRIVTFDLSGVDHSSLSLSVNGAFYGTGSPEVSWALDTIVFSPSTPFAHGDTVSVELLALSDTLGNGLAAPYLWWFVVDTEAPVLTGYSPPHDGEVSSTAPVVRMWLEDEPAGVDTTSVVIRIEGTEYHIGDPGCSWSGGQVVFDCSAAGLSFSDGDTVDVCFVAAADLVAESLCGPNSTNPDSCWFFRIDLSGPSADLLLPLDGSYTSCPNQEVWVYIYDDQGILPESTAIRVGDDTLWAYAGDITVRNDTAFYTPATPFSDGEVVVVQVVHATDSLGNTTTGGDIWSFTVDLSPPVWYNTDPPPGSFISDPAPLVSLWFVDSVSGVDPTTFAITVEGTPYVGMLPGVLWIDPQFQIDFGMLGYTYSDGDTVDFCFNQIGDLSGYCGANFISPDSCWRYFVDLSGPTASMVYPPQGAFFACEEGTIKVVLSDNFGVADSTVRLSVDGVVYSPDDPELWVSGDTVYFAPPWGFSDGDTVDVEVVSAQDLAGNDISSDGPWWFVVDLSGPVVVDVSPPYGAGYFRPCACDFGGRGRLRRRRRQFGCVRLGGRHARWRGRGV